MSETCNCFVARHPRAAEIDAALLAGKDPRDVAGQFGLGKSKVYEHRKHLQAGAPAAPLAPGQPPESPGRPQTTQNRSKSRSAESVESVEPRVETGGTDSTGRPPPTAITPRALPSDGAISSAYGGAVARSLELIASAQWRPSHVVEIAERFGLARSTARSAHAEAVRHLQLDMGGYQERQGVSAAYVTRERDAAKEQSLVAQKHAERWRAQEREAQELADAKEGDERIAALDKAARFGLLATKYDLSAEKWSAQALAHQRHLDDILCLRSPKEATQNVFHLSGDPAMFERFASLLAARFSDRPDILAALDDAAAEIEKSVDQGSPPVIDTTGVAA